MVNNLKKLFKMGKSTIKNIYKNDLQIFYYSIGIPKLTDNVVDESFAYCLERGLNDNGFSTKWVSLDDMGFISITFSNVTITSEQIEAVIKQTNELLK